MNAERPRQLSTCATARAVAGLAAATLAGVAVTLGSPRVSQAALPLKIAYLFRSPSGNVGCWTYLATATSGRGFVCKVLSTAARPVCEYGYAIGWWAATPRGALRPGKPSGDCTFRPEQGYQSVEFSHAPVLAYGRSTSLPDREVVCRSERLGVTCTNRAGHGFFLSRGSIRIF